MRFPAANAPGTLYVIEPETESDAAERSNFVETHSLDPAKVLRLVRRMGGRVDRLLLVGCEPSPLDADDMRQGLSAAVAAAVDEAVTMVQTLIDDLLESQLVNYGGPCF